MAELAPVPTGDPMPHIRIGPNLGRWPLRVTHSPPGPRRLAAHLQVPASVPAAPPPKPRGRVMPAEARTSTLAPPKYRRCFGPRSPRGWRVALRSGQGSVWGSRRGALAGCGTRDLTSSLDSRSHGADSGKRRERLPGEASAGAPPPGPAYLQRAGGWQAPPGTSSSLSQTRNLLPRALDELGLQPPDLAPPWRAGG